MACTACLVHLVGTVSGRSKNALGKGSTSSGHITKLEQSRFSLDIYGPKLPLLNAVHEHCDKIIILNKMSYHRSIQQY
jgi:hypothetical protein